MTSISTPTSLATFSLPDASSSKLPHVTVSGVYGSENPLAVVAVQGDGLWVYDLNTLRPITSYTCPPSTTFCTTPISYYPSKNAKQKQKATEDDMMVDASEGTEGDYENVTLIGVGKGEGSRKGEGERQIWAWIGEEGTKQVIQLDEPIHSLHYSGHSRHPICCVTKTGQVILLDANLSPRQAPLLEPLNAELLAVSLLPAKSTDIKIATVDKRGHVRVLKLGLESDELKAEITMQGWLDGKDSAAVLSTADISEEGVVTAIDTSGRLLSRNIAELSHPPPSSYPRFAHSPTNVMIRSLPSAGKPLALLTTSHPTPSILLTIPSASLPAVLSTSSISSLASSGGSISHLAVLRSHNTSRITIAAVLTHPAVGTESGRSVVYTCEISLPEKGIGMSSLLGVQQSTSTYLSQDSKHADTAGNVAKLLKDLSKAIKGATTVGPAEKVWADWIAVEDTKKKSGNGPILPESAVKQIVHLVFSSALTTKAASDEAGGEVETAITGVYARKIIQDLLSRRLVSDGMWTGGVVAGGLLPVKDWKNIARALKNVPTIPSSGLVLLIKASIHAPKEKSSGFQMNLVDLSREILNLPMPGPDYRVELKRKLPVEDAAELLEVLVRWVEKYVEKRMEWLGAWTGEESTAKVAKDLPSLEAVIAHSSLLLDAHLPNFLAYTDSHILLTRLHEALKPLMSISDQFRQLRAPVDAVLTLAKREARKQQERQEKRAAMAAVTKQTGYQGKKGKKGKMEKVDVVMAERNALPEEVVGQWRVEEFTF